LPRCVAVSRTSIGSCSSVIIDFLCRHVGERTLPSLLRLSRATASHIVCGIYDDTGSFTYENTSVADLRAAALLLRHYGVDMPWLANALSIVTRRDAASSEMGDTGDTRRQDGVAVVASKGDREQLQHAMEEKAALALIHASFLHNLVRWGIVGT